MRVDELAEPLAVVAAATRRAHESVAGAAKRSTRESLNPWNGGEWIWRRGKGPDNMTAAVVTALQDLTMSRELLAGVVARGPLTDAPADSNLWELVTRLHDQLDPVGTHGTTLTGAVSDALAGGVASSWRRRPDGIGPALDRFATDADVALRAVAAADLLRSAEAVGTARAAAVAELGRQRLALASEQVVDAVAPRMLHTH